MSKDCDVIVVGGGIVGAAIFHRLCCDRQNSILLIEKSRFGLGSTGGSGGILRCFHPDPFLSDLAVEGVSYYRDFEKNTGSSCEFTECGFLYFVDAAHEEASKNEIERLQKKGVEICWVSRKEGEEKFTHVAWGDLAGAAYEPRAGYMDPVATTNAWILTAESLGGLALEGVTFDGLLFTNGNLSGIQTSSGPIPANRVVMATGAWTPGIAKKAAIDLPREIKSKAIQLNTFRQDHEHGSFQAYIDPIHSLYGRAAGNRKIYVGSAVTEWGIDPDISTAPALSYSTLAHALGSKRFPSLASSQPGGGLRRFDAYTDDERGTISASSSTPGLFFATGFSGGGVKLAPAIASKIHELVHSYKQP